MFRKKSRLKVAVALIFLLLSVIFVVYRFFMVANEIAQAETTQTTTTTVLNISNKYLSDNSSLYSDILVKDKSPAGNIAAINTDIEKINLLQTEITTAILDGLSGQEGIKIKIPFGNIFGLPILLNFGPDISYNIAPVSNVHVRFEDSFKSAGINQTQFSVNLIIDTEVLYSLSAYQNKIKISNTLPVVQLLLVGEIPNNYANIQR